MAQGRLLVLDDDMTVAQILLMAAQGAGFEARWCEDVPGFIEAIRTWDPTHVAVDLRMPGTQPEQVMQLLADVQCRARIIVCSGAAPVDLQAALAQAQALGLQVAGALAKPFRLVELRALLI